MDLFQKQSPPSQKPEVKPMGDPEQWNPPREWDRPDWIMQIFMWAVVSGTICGLGGLLIGLQF